MEHLLKAPGTHAVDFLAEIVSRTEAAPPKRIRLAEKLVILAGAGDALAATLSFLLGFHLRFHVGLTDTAGSQRIVLSEYRGYIALGVLSLLVALGCHGSYGRHSLLQFPQTVQRIGKAWSVWIAGLLIFTTLYNFEPSISRLFIVLSSVITSASLLAWRWIFHCFICRRESIVRQLRERVLLVGWNEDAARLVRLVNNNPHSPYELVGFVPSAAQPVSTATEGIACLGQREELSSILKYSAIDIAILTDHHATRDEITEVATICEREIVQFQLVPSYFQILLSGLHLQNFSGIPLLGVSKLRLNHPVSRLLKRAMDIIGGAVGLLLAAPLIAIFGALVYLESPGPIFYRQRRVGRNGVPFDILKIRSMRLDAEKDGQAGWSTKVDPRRLRVGSFMRRYNIDEVPQFWNVLKGEMSLVGPRPERPELIAGFKHQIRHYNARHIVKPGITGWAQINGLRGDTDLAERIRCDIHYMENWSLGLDLQIMFLTFFKHANAC
jgi:exopolysaccharide biosynthesis polyprenyl glycosylphosphotransferase